MSPRRKVPMAFLQLVLLQITSQLTQALAVYAKAAGAAATTPAEKSKYSVWLQLANNFGKMATIGISAASGEFATQQTAGTQVLANEKSVVTMMAGLPPIT